MPSTKEAIMYIKPSSPAPLSDSGAKPLRANKKTESSTESFKDLLEEIDIVELSSELDPDEKRKNDLQKRQEEGHAQPAEVIEIIPESRIKGINRFV